MEFDKKKLNLVARNIARAVYQAYQDPEILKKYEEWKKARYKKEKNIA